MVGEGVVVRRLADEAGVVDMEIYIELASLGVACGGETLKTSKAHAAALPLQTPRTSHLHDYEIEDLAHILSALAHLRPDTYEMGGADRAGKATPIFSLTSCINKVNRRQGQAFEAAKEGTKGRDGRRGQGVCREATSW